MVIAHGPSVQHDAVATEHGLPQKQRLGQRDRGTGTVSLGQWDRDNESGTVGPPQWYRDSGTGKVGSCGGSGTVGLGQWVFSQCWEGLFIGVLKYRGITSRDCEGSCSTEAAATHLQTS